VAVSDSSLVEFVRGLYGSAMADRIAALFAEPASGFQAAVRRGLVREMARHP
jgi:hypothetical protein